MGRTNPTFRDALRAIESRWEEYRRALRRCDQPRFDRLFTYARDHADAGGLLNHRNPLFPTFLSIDLEQESRLDEHGDRLRDHDGRLRDHDGRLDAQGERLDAHDGRFDEHGDRLRDHDDRLRDHDSRLDGIEAELESLRERATRTEREG